MPAFDLIPVLLSVAALFYAGTFLALFIGLSRTGTQFRETPFVSVIVAARNEERHLPGLLDCLLSQQYPNYEVIIIDDRSSDASADIIRSRQSANPSLKLIPISSVDYAMPPKKNALTKGILASRGEILLFTDADCLPPPTWMSTMVARFDEETGLVAGYSPYQNELFGIRIESTLRMLFQAFIRYEELKMSIWSAGSIGVDRGWLCTGRNLAYRRRVWDEVSGFEKIRNSVSGDDDLFLQLVQRTTSWKTRYAVSPASHVPTRPPETAVEFIQQRKRHFSAGRFFSIPLKLFFIFFHGTNLFLYFSFAASFTEPAFAWGVPVFLVKSLVDLCFVFLGSRQLGAYPPLFSIPCMELGLLVYAIIIGPIGILGSFSWKPDPQ